MKRCLPNKVITTNRKRKTAVNSNIQLVIRIACLIACSSLGCASTKPTTPPHCDASAKPTSVTELTDGTSYGEPMKLASSETTPIKSVFADPAKYDGKIVRIGGLVESVCARRGCWMRLTDDQSSETLFVKFTCPVQGRLIPMDAVGKRAVVEGTLEVATQSEAEARHYKEDAGASPDEIKKIVGPQKVLRMRSPAAMVDARKAT